MKLLTTAPAGIAGRLVVREALKRPDDFVLVGSVGPKGRAYIGQDVSVAAMTGEAHAKTYDDVNDIIGQCDGVVDFSTVECSMAVLRACVAHKKPLVLATTGFSPEQEAEIREAAEVIPILETHNTSKAVNLIYELAREMTRVLGDESDIEIIEMHHRDKLDAPSGTSLELGRAIADELGKNLDDIADFGRHGHGRREEGHICYHSIRAGDISSTHTLVFGMMGERIEITHRAYDFTTFAKGALDGVLFLQGKPAGMYTFKDVLGF